MDTFQKYLPQPFLHMLTMPANSKYHDTCANVENEGSSKCLATRVMYATHCVCVCVCACLWQSRCVWAAFRSSIYPRSKKARVGGFYNQTCIWLLQSFPVLNLNRLHSRRGRQDSGFGSLKMEGGGRASVILGENKANDVVLAI